MDLVEQVASGIPRMREEMQEAGLPEPIFSTDSGFFTVEFKRSKKDDIDNGTINSSDDPENLNNGTINSSDDPENLNNGTINGTINDIINSGIPIEEIFLKLISTKEGLSARNISKLTDKSLRTTMRYIDILKKENKIEFRGALKTGGYYIK